jgi:hypothetical protein
MVVSTEDWIGPMILSEEVAILNTLLDFVWLELGIRIEGWERPSDLIRKSV